MASGTISTRPQADSAPAAGRYGDFIQERLEHTRRQVRLVDVGSNLILLVAASLFFFLGVAVADHWVFTHGLNFFARLLLWAIWLGMAGTFAWRFIAPSVMHRINPVYAAQAIEHGRPTLKNSLINFLLLRSHPEDIAPVVYQAMEHRAAADLSKVPVDQAVDHRRLLHFTYVLAAAVALFALYLVFSPKNPFTSAARVLWPWAGIQAPTRVHIEDVAPGDAIVFRDDPATISAHVAGLREGEEVALLISTADGEVVDDRVLMTRTGDDDRYACDLPPGGAGGMQQSTFYRITAGDATTKQYKLDVQIAPTIIVDQVDYHFPAYTGFTDRTIKGQADIKALEGTRVTIHASANLEIKDARVDLGCTGLRMLAMSHTGTLATAEFTLALDPENPAKPLYDKYGILYTDAEGRTARHPLRYRIDVDRDYPPEIEIVEPKSQETAVAVSGHLPIRIHAFDDFGLRHVWLHADSGERSLNWPVALDRIPPEKAVSGPYEYKFDFKPAAFNLKVGDRVTYWAAAEDNKEPRHNLADTKKTMRTIKIVASEQEAQQQQQTKKDQSDTGETGDGQPQKGGDGQGKPDNGNGQAGQDSGNGASKGDNASSKKADGGESSRNNPQKGDKGDKDDSGKPESGKGSKSSGSDGNSGDSTGQGSRQGEDKKPRDPGTQQADIVKDILDDKNRQEQQDKQQQSGNDSKPNPSEQQQQAGNQGGGQQNQQSQGNQPSGQNQSAQQQGGQPQNQQSQNGGSNAQQQGAQNNSASKDPNSQSGQQPNNSPDKQANSGQNNPGNQGGENQPSQQGGAKTSPPQNGNSQQAKEGSQPQAGSKPGEKQDAGQNAGQAPKNSADQAGQKTEKAKTSAGGEKNDATAGNQGKPQPKQDGAKGSQENSTAGGTQKPKEQQPGGTQSEQSQAGGTPNKAEKKPGGSNGSQESQLAMNGPKKNEEKKDSCATGGSAPMNAQGGSKPENKPKPENGSSSGGGGGSQTKQEKKEDGGGAGSSGGEKSPQKGSGNQPKSGSGKSSPAGSPSGKQGNMADGDSRQMEQGKTGDSMKDSSGAPDPQVDPQRSGNKPGEAQGSNDHSDKSKSPGNSPHSSDSKSQTKGDRKGGGGEGGGQPDKKAGEGAAGSSMPANKGGQASQERGPGATGNRSGETAKADNNTSSPRKESGERGNGEKQESSSQPSANNSQKPPSNSSLSDAKSDQTSSGGPAGEQSSQAGGGQGTGQPGSGTMAGKTTPPPPAAQPQQGEEDKPDLDFSKKQVDLALSHLKDEMKKQKPELLDKLGWTKEEAQKFYDNISKLRDSAQQPGVDPAKQKAYNEFLKNLDLHPHDTRIGRGSTKTDDMKDVIDAGDMAPPPDWADLSHAYSTGTAEQK